MVNFTITEDSIGGINDHLDVTSNQQKRKLQCNSTELEENQALGALF
ncbi:131_t:CDS:2 [Ambispora gerdemannii]|uniref:131_t:CDS:1 n=1 Tax=Ambispora gerdemannii TaxID=144530 RepID=A0A9N9G6X6_9GLOM|nr:131_t:CDS:2 [Ambispora gerdemannii]